MILFRIVQIVGKNPQDLAIAKNQIENQYLLTIESEFAKNHAEKEELIDDVVNYLKKLNGAKNIDITIEDKPAYLEWSVWRAMLIFNSLTVRPEKTRKFGLDADLMPIGCAPGGGPDIIMDYKDFVAVAEVTMTGGSRQEAAEGEPVRRHVAKVQLGRQDKEVYGLFIAPTIDDNTAEIFRNGTWWDNHKAIYLNVVPLTLQQFISIIESLKGHRRTTAELKMMFDRCLVFRNIVGPQWLQHIELEVGNWVGRH